MLFRVLGRIDFVPTDGNPLVISSKKKQVLLATLLADNGNWVRTDELIDTIWGERPPKSAAGSLKTYVWQLRALTSRAEGLEAIETCRGGYRINVGREEVDMFLFEDGVLAGADALNRREPSAALAGLETACRLWRGLPFADLEIWRTEAQTTWLTELWLVAQQALARARIATGAPAQAVVGLRQILTDHPLIESLHGLLMLGLYRSGRQADALAAFTRVRALLDAELGLPPCAELRELHQDILRQAPRLDSAELSLSAFSGVPKAIAAGHSVR
ncbi:AfsR/SARP family transcriptional regulator [Amycolatopsis japonica]|uniref:AfsR/SARP family transcriptional regulator n=1 Tax=Amycolatopsis japonica TaxID=208439 RepID=UPI00332CCC8E